jgi:hypothetical protein
VSGTKVTDLAAAREMPLTKLCLHGCTELTDLSPPADCPALENFTLPPDAKDIEFLRTDPKLERLGTNDAKTGGGLPDQRPRLSGSTGSASVTGAGGTVGTGDVMNNASFVVERTGLTTAAIDGTGNTTVTLASASLTANHIRQAGLSIGATRPTP